MVCCYFNCCNKIICWKTNKLLCQEDDVFSFSPQITSLYPTTLKAIHSVFTMFSFASLCPVDSIPSENREYPLRLMSFTFYKLEMSCAIFLDTRTLSVLLKIHSHPSTDVRSFSFCLLFPLIYFSCLPTPILRQSTKHKGSLMKETQLLSRQSNVATNRI